jgi:uncharacterized protein (TIGR02246 family)
MRSIALITLSGLTALAVAFGQGTETDDEKDVRAAIDAYTAAYNKGDLDALLTHVAPDADLIDENGKQYKGKASLGGLCKRALTEFKGQTLETVVTALRFLRPDVAIVDGTAVMTAQDGTAASGRFTATWTKSGDRWLLSSVRDLPDGPATPEAEQPETLKQLEWLIGDWASEDPNYPVRVSARWALNQRFLRVEYTLNDQDVEALTVEQYFAWDPVAGGIRSWFFDSEGGYGGGAWERQGDIWTATWDGVLADGRTASSVNSMKYIDEKSFLFRSVEREVGGLPMADVEARFVRKATGK